MLTPTEKIWHNGQFIAWDDAKIHVLSHVVSYGTSVFEGIRCYETASGTVGLPAPRAHPPHAGFRQDLPDGNPVHARQARRSHAGAGARQPDEVLLHPPDRAARLRRDGGVFRCGIPSRCSSPAGNGASTLARRRWPAGVDVCVSSWTRIAPNTLPAMAKAGANYMNSQLIKMEAAGQRLRRGHRAGRERLRQRGLRREHLRGSRRQDPSRRRWAPRCCPGITRDSVIRLAQDLGIPVVETLVPREMLYIADEVFFSGTAAEITPIRSIDKIVIGKGKRGPIDGEAAEGVLRDHRGRQAGPLRLADPGIGARPAGGRGLISKSERDPVRPPPPRSSARGALTIYASFVAALARNTIVDFEFPPLFNRYMCLPFLHIRPVDL